MKNKPKSKVVYLDETNMDKFLEETNRRLDKQAKVLNKSFKRLAKKLEEKEKR